MKKNNDLQRVRSKRRELKSAVLFDNLISNQKYLTATEAAVYMRSTVASVRAKARRGDLPQYRSGRKLLFKRVDLDRLIEASRNGGFR
ncbi:MAG: helix-turn-helix domain-containing protein [Pseudobdellovibrionaceae bacterium]|nr:MAG: helix-turn-helix domain-containing protein [Pseudobdellovibrionaceae bacterium]